MPITVDLRSAGAASVSQDAGGIEIATSQGPVLISETQAGQIASGIAALSVPPPPSKIVFIGDSVTVGARPGVGVTDTFVHKVGAARGFTTVINKGVGGDESADMILRFQADVLDLAPDHVCIMCGLNDQGHGVPVANYEANLFAMVHAAMQAGIKVTLCTTNIAIGSTWLAGATPFIAACAKVSAMIPDVAFVDVYSDWARHYLFNAAGSSLQPLLMSENGAWIHPSVAGHTRIANIILANPRACARP